MIEIVGDSPIEVDTKDGLMRIRLYAKNPKRTSNEKYIIKLDEQGRKRLIDILTNYSI